MDRLETYRQIIRSVLQPYTQITYANVDATNHAVFDPETDRYIIVSVGWGTKRRVHGCLIHVEMIDGKVWIQRDGTEDGIANELVEAGIFSGMVLKMALRTNWLKLASPNRKLCWGFANPISAHTLDLGWLSALRPIAEGHGRPFPFNDAWNRSPAPPHPANASPTNSSKSGSRTAAISGS